MRRINTSTKATDLHGAGKHGFKAGNSLTGELPTQFSATWADDVQEEIANAIEGASIVLGAGQAQLLAAITAIAAQQAQLAANPPGIVKHYLGGAAPAGWVVRNGGTIGNAVSGATERANADTAALFAHLWAETANTGDYVIQDSSGSPTVRGGSAAIDFAANKRMPLPDDTDNFDRGGTGAQIGIDYPDTLKAHDHSYNRLTAGGGTSTDGIANDGTIDQLTSYTTGSTGTGETAPKHRRYLPIIKL